MEPQEDRSQPKDTGWGQSPLEQFAFGATRYIGSPTSLILHSLFFVGIFGLRIFGISVSDIMLILTTIVSLEAIYLSIFIQLTVNRQTRQIEEVSEDIDDIQENVEEIQEDAREISEDVENIKENVEEIQEDAREISEDVENIKENVEDLSEELEKDENEEIAERSADQEKIHGIERKLEELLREIKTLKN